MLPSILLPGVKFECNSSVCFVSFSILSIFLLLSSHLQDNTLIPYYGPAVFSLTFSPFFFQTLIYLFFFL